MPAGVIACIGASAEARSAKATIPDSSRDESDRATPRAVSTTAANGSPDILAEVSSASTSRVGRRSREGADGGVIRRTKRARVSESSRAVFSGRISMRGSLIGTSVFSPAARAHSMPRCYGVGIGMLSTTPLGEPVETGLTVTAAARCEVRTSWEVATQTWGIFKAPTSRPALSPVAGRTQAGTHGFAVWNGVFLVSSTFRKSTESRIPRDARRTASPRMCCCTTQVAIGRRHRTFGSDPAGFQVGTNGAYVLDVLSLRPPQAALRVTRSHGVVAQAARGAIATHVVIQACVTSTEARVWVRECPGARRTYSCAGFPGNSAVELDVFTGLLPRPSKELVVKLLHAGSRLVGAKHLVSASAVVAFGAGCATQVTAVKDPVAHANALLPALCGDVSAAERAAVVLAMPNAVAVEAAAGIRRPTEGFPRGFPKGPKAPNLQGATLQFAAGHGVTTAWLQRQLECHQSEVVTGRAPLTANDPYVLPEGWLDIRVKEQGSVFVVERAPKLGAPQRRLWNVRCVSKACTKDPHRSSIGTATFGPPPPTSASRSASATP